jgi:hypothetical protein
MYEEVKVIFERKLLDTYGELGRVDYFHFLGFLFEDEELKNTGWKIGEELPFELEDLIDEWIQQDKVYQSFIH